jgi:predicted aspartyl protease
MMIIKRYFLFLCLLFSLTLKAQNADNHINELISKSDWFTLDKEYSVLKDSITDPICKLVSEALLGLRFNRQQDAIIAIDTLLNRYQSEMGLANTTSFFNLAIYAYGDQGRYAEAADLNQRFLTQLSPNMTIDEINRHKRNIRFNNSLGNENRPVVILPSKDRTIPFQFVSMNVYGATMGNYIVIPISIHGKIYRFCFDTGATGCVIPERVANEIGLKTLVDSIRINGVRESSGHVVGLLDSFSIGDISCKNIQFLMNKTKVGTDSVFFSQIDGILGLNVIKRLGEMQFLTKDKIILFPAKQTEVPITSRNMTIMLDDNNVVIRAFSGDKPLMMHFDSGASNSCLSNKYYLSNKSWIESNCKLEDNRKYGSGGLIDYKSYRIPSLPFKVGELSFTLNDFPVEIGHQTLQNSDVDGTIGNDLIAPFSRVIVNFDKMFIEFKR